MKLEEIRFNHTGASILGFPISLTPTAQDFDLAFEGEVIRDIPPLNGRQLRICDSKGLSWLVDIEHKLVLWLDILLAPLRYRRMSDMDPSGCFTGKIRIGQYAVQGPFSFETGELVRKVTVDGLSVSLLPDEKQMRAVSVAFVQNESLLK